jgi:hypothetical protein
MSSANDSWSFHNLSDDWLPARAAGARVSATLNRSDHILSVTVWFAGVKPSSETVDRVLRECAAFAAARDSSFDVFLDAEWLPSADSHYREYQLLYPYGRDHFLCFDARLRQVGVRRHGDKRFAKPWPVDDIAALCRQAYVEHEPNPLSDYEDSEDVDSAESDLRAEVVRWIWYGYHSPEQIGALIKERADEDEDIDADVLHAFAAHVLAKKRAAEATWPEETDNDRLDDAFADLTEGDVFAMQYAGDCLDEGAELVHERTDELDPNVEKFEGACFFHTQDMDHAFDGEGLRVAFLHLYSEDADDYVAIGTRVVEALRQRGLQPVWSGTDNERIHLPGFRWRRRTPD